MPHKKLAKSGAAFIMIYKERFMKFVCTNCGKIHDELRYRCPKCASSERPPRGILKVLYDPGEIVNSGCKTFDDFERAGYLPLLPLRTLDRLSPLKVGNTPLCKLFLRREANSLGYFYLKDESRNPTFSYKDRASDIVCAYAAENGYDTIAAASTGNAGSSLAGIAASNGQRAIVFAPASAPPNKLLQIVSYGARLIPVEGSYDDAFELCNSACEKFGWFNRNTAWNTLTIEGKKTCSFEIVGQMRGIPTDVFVPVGDGVIIAGIIKGFEDMAIAGFIKRMPRFHAVQSEGSANLLRNLDTDVFQMTRAHTFADSISVDYPSNFYMVRRMARDHEVNPVVVGEEEIRDAMKTLARDYGVFSEPAAAAAFAGFLRALDRDDVGDYPVVINTGCGLKDPAAFATGIEMPKPVKPELSALEKYLA